jgi:hypothetical protein
VAVVISTWATPGQVVYVQNGGYYTVSSVPDATHVVLTNLGYTGNAAPAVVIATSQKVGPGGLKGIDGTGAGITLNSLSPTTTRGDLIVDNGALNPNASDVRLAVGTNGQMLIPNSVQATGLQWKTVIPNAVTADNTIPRYDGASGEPTPLQTSKVIINDNGAVQATGSGGNARGTDAVDLQVNRAGLTQVASGNKSVICGGENNSAEAADAAVVGGIGNHATGVSSFVGGGSGNQALADTSVIAAGLNNTITGANATIGGGSTNTCSFQNSTIGGGVGNVCSDESATVAGGNLNKSFAPFASVPGGFHGVADKYGQTAHASGMFAAEGDAQTSELIWRILTTDATANVEAFLDGASLRATIAASKSWVFDILVIARSSAGVSAAWRVAGAIQNNAGTTALVAAVTTTVLADGTGATWGVAGSVVVDADNANDTLRVRFTGAAATNIRWVARARLVEVSF